MIFHSGANESDDIVWSAMSAEKLNGFPVRIQDQARLHGQFRCGCHRVHKHTGKKFTIEQVIQISRTANRHSFQRSQFVLLQSR